MTSSATWKYVATIYYLYDENGSPIGMCYETAAGYDFYYYYRKNAQGDIIAVLNENGYEVVTYLYDA